MIKLNWYVLTKPHIVHRYYRIKEGCPIGSAIYLQNRKCYILELPNKNVDKGIYIQARDVFGTVDPRAYFPIPHMEERILNIIDGSSVKFYKVDLKEGEQFIEICKNLK